MKVWSEIAAFLARDGLAALVSLRAVKGSSPREAGATMIVRRDGAFRGSIGGGALEFESLARASALLSAGQPHGEERVQALGPDLGQCCGGRVTVAIEVFSAADAAWIAPLAERDMLGGRYATRGELDAAGRRKRYLDQAMGQTETIEFFGINRTPLYLFGAGHVGRALVLALAPLPFKVHWIDDRADAFPAHLPATVETLQMADPPSVLADAPPGALVVAMTHSHPLDLAIAAAALRSAAIAMVGVIGSDTKRARFVRQLRTAGLDEAALARLVCPIGSGRVRDKSPAAIAAVLAVELLQARESALTAVAKPR